MKVFSLIALFALFFSGIAPLAAQARPATPAADAQVKVAHFAPFANTLAGTSVTVRVNGGDVLTDFTYGESAGPLALPAGEYLLEVLPTGTSTVAISATVNLMADQSYTVAAIGDGVKQPLALLPLADDLQPPTTGAKLRIAHLAPFAASLDATRVDICTDTGTAVPGLSGLPYRAVTAPSLALPAGDYNLKITAAGSACATTLLDLPSVRLNTGEAYDLFAIGDGTHQPVAFASLTGLDLTPASVRVAHFAPFANTLAGTSVTVRVNGGDALTDFRFGDFVGPVELPAGSTLVEILPTGTSTVAISASLTLDPAGAYTLAAIGDGANQPLALLALEDDNQGVPGFAKVRIAHLAPFASTADATRVDICTEAGAVVPGLAGIPYGGLTDPALQLPPGWIDLKITAAGSNCATTLIDVPPVRLWQGMVLSVFALGDGVNFTPRVQAEVYRAPDLVYLPSVSK